MDVFQVRGMARQQFGHYYMPIVDRDSLVFHYCGRDKVARETAVHLSPPPERVDGTTAIWKLKLPPFKRFQIQTTVTPLVEGKKSRAGRADFAHDLRQRREAFAHWESQSANFKSSSQIFDEMVRTCVGDFHALQIPDGREHVIAAGIPWFATMFGRDSIIVSLQSLAFRPTSHCCSTPSLPARHCGCWPAIRAKRKMTGVMKSLGKSCTSIATVK